MEEEGKLPMDRLFWVQLGIFGPVFGAGLAIVPHSSGWGLLYIIVGLTGMIVLVRDRVRKTVRKVPVRTPLLVIACAAMSLLVGQTVSQITTTQADIKAYVMPRVVTEEQAAEIQKVLSSHHSPVAVLVFANPGDSEALDYASQLNGAINGGGWEAHFGGLNPWDTSPNSTRFGTAFNNMFLALDRGVVIRTGYLGQRGNPDPKNPTPDELLSMAFHAAHIEFSVASAADQEKYSLIVEVGHRPTIIDKKPSVWFRLGRWLMSFDK